MNAKTVDPKVVEARANELRDKLSTLRAQLAERAEADSGKATAGNSDQSQNSKAALPIPKMPDPHKNPNRPKSLDDIVGQSEVTMMLRLSIAGAQLRGEPFGHVLVTGGPGLGKSSLASVVAQELDLEMVSTTGMLLRKATDIIGILGNLEGPAVVFIDECHLMTQAVAAVLYQVCEDQAVDLLNGTGPNAVATTKQLPGVVLVCATTHPGKLSQSFRDRIKTQLVMSDYSDQEIATIVRRYWKSQGVQHFKGEDMELARRSRGIPRLALQLAGHVVDYVFVNEQTAITTGTTDIACRIYGVDENGHNDLDRAILEALTGPFAARAVGLDALAAYLGVEPTTIENAHENYLVRQELVVRTGRGRCATAKAYDLVKGAKS